MIGGDKASLEEFLESLPEWQDEETTRILFSSFSQPRNVNPESYDARIRFWRVLLIEATRRSFLTQSVFCLPDSKSTAELLQRKGIKPLGIAQVMKVMVSDGIAKPQFEEVDNEEDFLLLRLARLSLKASINWGWNLIIGEDTQETLVTSQLDESQVVGPVIITSLLKEMTEALVKANSQREKQCFFSALSLTEFKLMVQNCRQAASLPPMTDPNDFDLIIRYMRDREFIAVREEEEGLVLKIFENSGRKSADKEITNEECNIIKLRSMQSKLHRRIDRLSTEIQAAIRLAKEALGKRDRSLAIFELQRHKALDNIRRHNMQALATMREILDNIDSAHSSAEIFNAYRAGENALRSILSSSKISPEAIDDVMVSLSEAIGQQDEISTVLATSVPLSIEINEKALEEELAALIQAPLAAEVPDFPSIPQGIVGEEPTLPPVVSNDKDIVNESGDEKLIVE